MSRIKFLKRNPVESDYEKSMREKCEMYFEQKDLVRWETQKLPCTMLEGLDDCGLITYTDTIVYLPKNSILKGN